MIEFRHDQKSNQNQDFDYSNRDKVSYKYKVIVVDRSPLGKFTAWCINKTTGTFLEKITGFIFQNSVVGKFLAVIIVSLIIGALTDLAIISVPITVNSPIFLGFSFITPLVLGAIGGGGTGGIGGAIVGGTVGLLIGWLAGQIADATISQVVSKQLQPYLTAIWVWTLSTLAGMYAGKITEKGFSSLGINIISFNLKSRSKRYIDSSRNQSLRRWCNLRKIKGWGYKRIYPEGSIAYEFIRYDKRLFDIPIISQKSIFTSKASASEVKIVSEEIVGRRYFETLAVYKEDVQAGRIIICSSSIVIIKSDNSVYLIDSREIETVQIEGNTIKLSLNSNVGSRSLRSAQFGDDLESRDTKIAVISFLVGNLKLKNAPFYNGINEMFSIERELYFRRPKYRLLAGTYYPMGKNLITEIEISFHYVSNLNLPPELNLPKEQINKGAGNIIKMFFEDLILDNKRYTYRDKERVLIRNDEAIALYDYFKELFAK